MQGVFFSGSCIDMKLKMKIIDKIVGFTIAEKTKTKKQKKLIYFLITEEKQGETSTIPK